MGCTETVEWDQGRDIQPSPSALNFEPGQLKTRTRRRTLSFPVGVSGTREHTPDADVGFLSTQGTYEYRETTVLTCQTSLPTWRRLVSRFTVEGGEDGVGEYDLTHTFEVGSVK